jgi:Ca2+-binding RTX toxin-like protein
VWSSRVTQPPTFSLGGAGDDLVTGLVTGSLMQGGAGNDTLEGAAGDETLEGGTGNDALNGGEGNDVYRFSAGFGQDVIDDTGTNPGDGSANFDIVEFDATIAPGDVIVEQTGAPGGDLVLRFTGSDDRLTIVNGAEAAPPTGGIDEIHFSDGTVWDLAEILSRVGPANPDGQVIDVVSVAVDDSLTGTTDDDTLDGEGGNDTLDGLGGNDVLLGGDADDLLIGGPGNDYLQDTAGTNTFRFAPGFGRDELYSGFFDGEGGTPPTTIVEFDAAILPADLVVYEDVPNGFMLLSFAGTDDTLQVALPFDGGEPPLTEVRFLADSSVLTFAQLEAVAIPLPRSETDGDETPETITGTDAFDLINGFGGDDTLDGGGGNDQISGGDGFDEITGGPGDDNLFDGGGGALYKYSAGFGQDYISNQLEDSVTSAIEFDATIPSTAVDVIDTGFGEIILRIVGSEDRITIETFGGEVGLGSGIDEVRFSDGTIWTAADLAARARQSAGVDLLGDDVPVPPGGVGDDSVTGNSRDNVLVGNDGNDTLDGQSGDDTLTGGAGDDSLVGGSGDDTYIFSAGFGQDFIDDSGWTSSGDTIVFDASIDPANVRVHEATDNSGNLILLIDGTGDRITIEDGTFDDFVTEVRFDFDGSVWTRDDLLAAATPLPGDVINTSDAPDSIVGTPLDDRLEGLGGDDDIAGLAGDDTITGGLGNDTIDPGPGDDVVTDAAGDETYRFAPGDGRVQITDLAGTDRLEFAAGIAATDVSVTQRDGADIILRFAGSEDRVELLGALNDTSNRIEEIAFDGGPTWTYADLIALLTAGDATAQVLVGSPDGDTIDGGDGDDDIDGTFGDDDLSGGAGSDTVAGGEGNDTLTGGPGADELLGGPGDDVYRYAAGDGQVSITDTDGVETIEIGPGLLPADITVFAAGGADLVLQLTGTEDRLILKNVLTDPSAVIESVVFDDSTTWTHVDLLGFAAANVGDDDVVTGTEDADTIATGSGDDQIDGLGGADDIDAGPGNDTTEGGTGNDSVTGGPGNDQLSDADGDDTYFFAPGDGQDVISDLAGTDAIVFAAGISASDVFFTQPDANDLIIRFVGSEDRIRLANVLSDPSARIEELRFDDGSSISFGDMLLAAQTPTDGPDAIFGIETGDALVGGSGDDALSGADGDDDLSGGAGADILEGSTGNDTLSGGTGPDSLSGGENDDTYVYNLGDGQDTIDDSAGTDTIAFGPGLLAADITVRRSGSDLELRFGATEDRLTIVDGFDGTGTIETLQFDDGTVWTAFDLIHRANAGTAGDDLLDGTSLADVILGLGGDDTLNGLAGEDSLTGGAGDDLVSGGAEGDTYIFAAGDGVDIIDDQGGTGTDILQITGHALGDARFSRTGPDGADLTIRFAGSDDRIIVAGQFAAVEDGKIESFEIGGAILPALEVETRVQPDVGADGDVILGDETAETLNGTPLGDYIEGGDGADTILGGDGDDIFGDIAADDAVDELTGGAGRDTYRYLPVTPIAGGVAEDVITDFTPGDGGDIIRLAASVPNPFELGRLSLAQDGADTTVLLLQEDGSTTSVLRLLGVDATALTAANFGGVTPELGDGGGPDPVSDDETGNLIDGGPEADFIFGNGGADTISGFAGSDSLAGGADGDSISGGFDDDLIAGEAGNDTITGGAGDDVLSGGIGDDSIEGGDADAEFAGNDTFSGGAGDDALIGGAEDDTYVFGATDDRDTIIDAGGTDGILFDATVDPADVIVLQKGDDLELRVITGNTRILLVGALADPVQTSIESVTFDDGTVWDLAQLLSLSMVATEGDDALAILSGNTLSGLGGNDTIDGSDGADTLAGNAGDDLLRGGLGDDTYQFGLGDGQDAIEDASGANVVELGAGLTPADLRVVPGLETVVLEIISTGERIDLGQMPDPAMSIVEVRFAGGETWSAADLVAFALASSEGDDVIFGSDAADVITGGGGDDRLVGKDDADDLAGGPGVDILEGGGGDDTYRFGIGDQQDRILDTSGTNDVLILGPGIGQDDVSVSQSSDGSAIILTIGTDGDRVRIDDALGDGRIETVRFEDGTEWSTADLLLRVGSPLDDYIFGDDTDNQIDGGLGNDRMTGGAGNDTYLYTAGDGRDIIRDGSTSGADQLLIAGYVAADIRFTRLGSDSDDLAIRFIGTSDQIIIADGLRSGRGIETITLLDDGTSYGIADVTANLIAAQATDGDDNIIGSDLADTLDGGLGNDLLAGERGDDLYTYAAGDGDDRIEVFGQGINVIDLVDINPAEVLAAFRAGPDSFDLVLVFETPGDRLTIIDALGDINGGLSSVILRFADNTEWDGAEMRAQALDGIQTDGPDRVFGFDGNDIFNLGPGDDFASGRDGSDTYRYQLGDGADRIEDTGTEATDTDTLRLIGFDADEATVSRLFRGSETILIEFAGNDTDSVMVIDALADDATSIENYVFDNSVTWTRATILTLLDNQAPVANDDGFFGVTAGEELVIRLSDVLGNDFDADGDPLVLDGVDGSPNGTATIDGAGNIRFTSAPDFIGATTILYRISDGRNAFDEAFINVNVRPVASATDDAGFAVAEDEFLSIDSQRLLANDADGDRMIIGRVFDAVNGTVALTSDGNVGFTPDADYNGPAQFSYEANTPEGGEAIATVFIDVTPVNDAPTARNDTGFSGDENTTFVIAAADLLANDSDIDGDGFGLLSVASTAQLLVSLNADGDVEVTPVPDFFGPATFSYTIEDSGGATSEATVFVTVDAVNSLPTAVDDRFELTQAGDPILEDNPIIINLDQLVANDFDLDGDDLVLSRAFGATNGRVQLLDNQTVLFEPTENFNGEATFQYEIDDGQGGTDTGTATIVYQPVNDRPDARFDRYNDDTLIVLQGTQDQDLVIPIAELLKNDFDIEGFAVTFENATGPVNGDLVVDGDSIIFTPDPGFYGQATFGYSISDPEGLVDGALVTMFFAATSDVPPLPENDQFLVAEDIPTVIRLDTLLANDIDPDADPIQVTGFRELNGLADAFKFGGKAAGPLNGTLELNADGDILFTPFIDATLSSGFVYRVSDGEDGVTEAFVDIEIVPSNDDPTVVEDPGFVTPFDVPLVIRTEDLLFNDYDIEQADTDGDGTIDVPLDDPDRPRPEFVAVDAFLDPVELAQGNRVNVGTFEIVDFRGDSFVVARFDQGFTGEVIIEYRIADEEGLEDTGFAYANVADFYDGTLTGTPFIDYIEGNALSETILGYRRDDWIVALAGDDTIVTGLGEDLIEAGIGDDVINPGDDADDVRGGLGFDTVLFAGSNTGVRADLQTLIGQGGFAQGDLYSGIEAFEGTAFNDTLGGDDAANSLSGLGGNDELVGRGGVDTLLGGDGEDTLDGGADGDTLDGGDDSDTASYFFSTAGVTISLADGTASGGWAEGDSLISIENVLGTEFVDAITGNDADNYLSGDRGDDTLDGGGGDDTLSGGRGGDELIGGDGTDTADYSLSVDGINIDLAAGTASGGDAEGDTLDGIEVIRASFQDDVLAGDGGDNHFRGSRGADDIDGRDGLDTADYATADEAVHVDLSLGQGLAGEALGDTLTSIEKLIGSTFDDTFVGSAMAEVFDGRFGADLLQGRAGSDDYLFGFDSGADLIRGRWRRCRYRPPRPRGGHRHQGRLAPAVRRRSLR